MLPQPLIFTVPGENLLLLPNQLRSGNQFFGGVGEIRLFVREFLLLIGNLTESVTAVVEFIFRLFQPKEFVAHADDLQERLGFLFVVGIEEFRQVDGKLGDKFVKKLLAAFVAVGVDDLERAVFAFALDDKTVVERYTKHRRSDGTIALCGGWAVFISPQGPGDGIQDGGFALAVASADDGQPVGGR